VRTARRPALILTLLLLVAAALRVYGLDSESAWLDETFSVGIARDSVDTILYETSKDVHPPLYYFVLRAWLLVFGPSVWTARLLSVVLSVGLLAATFAVGRRLVGDAAALSAVAFLAVSVFHVEFAQEARMYTLLALAATLSMGSFVRLFDPELDRRWFAAYAGVTSIMTYTHVYSTFVLAGQALVLFVDLVTRPKEARVPFMRWLFAMALVFIAFLPWLPTFTWQVSHVRQAFWIPAPSTSGWFEAFRTYAGSSLLLYLLGPLAMIGAAGLASSRHAHTDRRPALLFLLPWMLAPILVPFALSFFGSSIFLPKYTIAASIPFSLLAGAGLVALRFRPVQAVVLTAALALSALNLPAYYRVLTKDGWRDAVTSVEARAEAGDLILVYPYYNDYAYDFYRQRDDVTVRQFPLHSAPPPEDGWAVTMARATGGFERVWFVTLTADPTAAVALDQLRLRFHETSHDVIQKVSIHRFELHR
jgi:4-amino-4-deoxy-L-arabinose transferase-like glycosyltransferase